MTSAGVRGSPLSTNTNTIAWYVVQIYFLSPPFVIAAVIHSAYSSIYCQTALF